MIPTLYAWATAAASRLAIGAGRAAAGFVEGEPIAAHDLNELFGAIFDWLRRDGGAIYLLPEQCAIRTSGPATFVDDGSGGLTITRTGAGAISLSFTLPIANAGGEGARFRVGIGANAGTVGLLALTFDMIGQDQTAAFGLTGLTGTGPQTLPQVAYPTVLPPGVNEIDEIRPKAQNRITVIFESLGTGNSVTISTIEIIPGAP